MSLLVVSALLAAWLGFTAHRASICTVRAVAEVMTSRRAYIFMSFVKTAAWVIALSFPLAWWLPGAHNPLTDGWPLTYFALAGGFLFGIGAALNGGCAFSTLTRLGAGDLRMLATLAGFCFGVAGLHAWAGLPVPWRRDIAPAGESIANVAAIVVVLGAWPWAAWEALRLWRTRPREAKWRDLVLADAYRLSTAAMVLGIGNAILYVTHGAWAYTGTLAGETHALMAESSGPGSTRWLLFVAAMIGVALSAWQRRSFRLVWRPRPSWLRHVMGGASMGFGGALAPGGNDYLILHAIPGLSAHAIPAYLAMLCGIAVVLFVMRSVTGMSMCVDCRGDTCRSEADRSPMGGVVQKRAAP